MGTHSPQSRETSSAPYLEKGSATYRWTTLAFFATGLATFASLYCVQPLFPNFSRSFGVSPAGASLSLSVSTFFLAITLPVAGALSDALGRKNVMTTAIFGTSLCCLFTALSPGFGALLVLRAIQGILLAGLPAVAMAYLSEEVAGPSLGYAMGLLISGNAIGGLSGRIIVSMVTDATTWSYGIGAIAVVSLAASLFFWRKLPASRHFRASPLALRSLLASVLQQFQDPALRWLYLVGATIMGGYVTMYNYLTYRLLGAPYHLSQSVVGWIFLVYLVGSFSSSWMGRLADRVGRRSILWWNILIMAAGAVITLAGPLVAVIGGLAVFTFGFFGSHSTASSWIGRRALSGKGQASALYLLFYYGGSSISGTMGGFLWSGARWPGIVMLIVGLLALAMVAAVALWRIPPRSSAPA